MEWVTDKMMLVRPVTSASFLASNKTESYYAVMGSIFFGCRIRSLEK
jgi:hypothetical protein